ncbi:MAG: septum formation initiator family protein [Bacilli bacterium]|nr:septum formation initiator family protein [Bacilli bacterium]
MAKYKKRMKPRKRALAIVFLSFLIIVGVTFSIGRYWVEIIEKYQEKQELEKELTSLKEKEEELQVDANKLQNPDYVARYAREKYLYSKDGEYILQIPDE